LAPWACDPSATRGRRIVEPADPSRSEHQRDRDRIVHSTAFRRLVYKTQVFVNHEGDLFRTRLTHSLEVAQLGRSVARALRLNEDLVEAIALAHDLGHTPFGHAGQDALAACMRAHGGFEHNLQSLRVVDVLEVRYAAFDGLNLTLETREGVLKHCSAKNAALLEAAEPGGVAHRFIAKQSPSLEAQLVNVADAMAYHVHDIDDGIRAGLISMASCAGLMLFDRCRDAALQQHPQLARDEPGARRRLLAETLRRMLAAMVQDLVQHTQARLRDAALRDAQAVRSAPLLVDFSPGMQEQVSALGRHLFATLYRHPQVQAMTDTARAVVTELYDAYSSTPSQLPADHANTADRPRAVADYIAGMTDRHAQREYQRLFGRDPFAGAV
jgi:dGTPase